MRIAVLVKQVPDTEEHRTLDMSTGRIDRTSIPGVLDQVDEVALEVALQAKDADKSVEVVAVTMGPDSARDALRTCLAMGADRAVHVCDSDVAGADALATARVLAAAVRQCEPDLVVAGNESTDGRCGVVPAAIAQYLAVPYVPSAELVRISATSVQAEVRVDDRLVEVAAELPALVAVTERAAEARFATLRGIMSAKRKPVEVVSVADLGVLALSGPASVVAAVSERPPRASGQIIADGADAVDELVDFLVSRRVIQ